MEQFLQFAQAHWQLFAALFVIAIAITVFELQSQANSLAITPQVAVNWINHEQAIVVDIRNQESFAKGHIIGSKSIPSENIATALKHKNKPVLIVCTRGSESEKSALVLKKAGVEKVAILKGGIESWVAAELPLEKNK